MRKNLPRSSRQSLNLNPYIQVEEVKDDRKRVQFRFIRFNLDLSVLDRILLAKATGRRLYIERHLLAELRSYALVDGESRLQSGLTFCSYYSEPKSGQTPSENILMRSVISLDGDIMHQVRRDCLEDATRCRAIATAHHWLIEQLLNQLCLKKVRLLNWLNWLSWGLSFLIVAVLVIVYVVNFNTVNPLFILPAGLVMWGILQVSLKSLLFLLLPPFQAWAFRQWLRWLISNNPRKRRMAKGILARFVP